MQHLIMHGNSEQRAVPTLNMMLLLLFRMRLGDEEAGGVYKSNAICGIYCHFE